ncbi:hypothetical protein BpHYR1_033265 [Brachionus plicatilis]|uniref:Uncharacterized protein n=1 Tax=Brachionus plicatilis TaxID=10195 RepID=A0A3M7QJS2_BRAPC|nr:hypothetical protein BpHYR1_033265 [Brachionus plicatilis]
MFNEHVFWFVQLCFSIAVLALTMIVVASAFKVIMNLWTGQNKNSNAGFQFANTNELFNGTPEKVRQDYLEKSAIKSEPTNKWRNEDQIGCSGNSRGRSFPNTNRNFYSSSEQEHHGLKSLLEPIKTHNAFGKSWREPLFNDSSENNVVFPKYRFEMQVGTRQLTLLKMPDCLTHTEIQRQVLKETSRMEKNNEPLQSKQQRSQRRLENGLLSRQFLP